MNNWFGWQHRWEHYYHFVSAPDVKTRQNQQLVSTRVPHVSLGERQSRIFFKRGFTFLLLFHRRLDCLSALTGNQLTLFSELRAPYTISLLTLLPLWGVSFRSLPLQLWHFLRHLSPPIKLLTTQRQQNLSHEKSGCGTLFVGSLCSEEVLWELRNYVCSISEWSAQKD